MRSDGPDGWLTGHLGEHADLLVGFAFKSAHFTDNAAGVRLLRGDNVGQGRLRWHGAKRWPAERCAEFERYVLSRHDVVLAMDRPWIEAGLKCATVRDEDLPCLLVQRVARFRGTSTLLQRYVPHLIGSPAFSDYVRSVQTGTAVPHISGGQIAAFPLLLPPVREQARIASVLGALDDKIDSNQRLSQRLSSLTHFEFRHRFAGRVEGPHQLNDHVVVVRGRSYKSSELVDSERALVTLKSVRAGGGYNPAGLKPYDGDFKGDQVVRPGEIVVAHTDLTQEAAVIGKPAIVPDNHGFTELVASLDLGIVRPSTNRLSVPFLYHLFLEPSFQQHAYGYANGSTVLHLSKEAIPSFSIELPDPDVLAAYDAMAQPMLESAHGLLAENLTLASLRDALLPKVISGDIRVPDTVDFDEISGPVGEEMAEMAS